MKGDNVDLLYIQEIPEAQWINEMLSEQFDNAIEMLTTNAIIYGGAIRDYLANKELDNSLDIAVPRNESRVLSNRFNSSPKWAPVDPARYVFPKGVAAIFKTIGDKVVRITPVCADKKYKNNPFHDILDKTRQANVVSSCVALLKSGQVIETIPGAYEDCNNGVLHYNKMSDCMNMKQFTEGVKELISKGWVNKINMGHVSREFKKRCRKKYNKPYKLPKLAGTKGKQLGLFVDRSNEIYPPLRHTSCSPSTQQDLRPSDKPLKYEPVLDRVDWLPHKVTWADAEDEVPIKAAVTYSINYN